MTLFLGIDPGKNGGMVVLGEKTKEGDEGKGRKEVVDMVTMPKEEVSIWSWLSQYRVDTQIGDSDGGGKEKVVACIEKVRGYIGEDNQAGEGKGRGGRGSRGGMGSTGSSMFTFGVSYGGLRMALIGLGFREGLVGTSHLCGRTGGGGGGGGGGGFFSVRPQEWQKPLGLLPRAKKGKIVKRIGRADKGSTIGSVEFRSPGESKTAWKGRLRDKAQELLDSRGCGVRVSVQLADAFLIAWWCREVHGGKVKK